MTRYGLPYSERYNLLPCPFCGVYPVTHKVGDANAVTCEGCGASITDDGKPWEAARMWNTRTETLEATVRERDGLMIDGTVYTPERTCQLIADSCLLHCSECGGVAEERLWAYWSYCPNCGAKVVAND